MTDEELIAITILRDAALTEWEAYRDGHTLQSAVEREHIAYLDGVHQGLAQAVREFQNCSAKAPAMGERNLIRSELRKIAARCQQLEFSGEELAIRRAIEDIFDGPIPPDEPQSTGRGVRK